MGKKLYLSLFTLFITLGIASAQETIVITDGDLQSDTYNWTNNNEYILDGFVFLEPGGVLNIEPGTVIRGRSLPSNANPTSLLVITRGAQIFAEGSVTDPIIFTAEVDDLTTSFDLTDRDAGLWGGIIVLGSAQIADVTCENLLEGFSQDEPRVLYGNSDCTFDNTENSGVLKYVSIRHAGAEVSPGQEINGLTLAAIGSSTIIDYVETFACFDDGVEFWGGTVNAKHLVSGFCQDDAFDIDFGWKGNGQFWFGIQGDYVGGRLLESDGGRPDCNEDASDYVLSNLTFIAQSSSSDIIPNEEDLLLFRDGSEGTFSNSIVYDFAVQSLVLEEVFQGENAPCSSLTKFQDGELVIQNNLFYRSDLVLLPENLTFDRTGGSIIDQLVAANNGVLNPQLAGVCRLPNGCLNPLLRSTSVALSGATAHTDAFFDGVSYIGAFDDQNNWALGWTALDAYGYFGVQAAIEGNVLFDGNEDCLADPEDTGLQNWFVEIQGVTDTILVATDAGGNFYQNVNPGTYNIELQVPNNYWGACTNDIEVIIPEGSEDLYSVDLLARAITSCPALEVDISTPFLRRCFENYYSVQYSNLGTATAENAMVEVQLDPYFEFIGATVPATDLGENLFQFDLGDLEIGARGSFRIDLIIDCDSTVLGQVHCVEANIFPDTNCDESSLLVPTIDIDSKCEGDSVQFTLKNISEINMPNPATYFVIEDDVMYLNEAFQLDAGASTKILLEANGSTWHMRAERNPGILNSDLISAFIEGCGTNEEGAFSIGFANQFSLTDFSTTSDLDCQPNIGAFDPNDKQAFPVGYGEDYFIEPNTNLDYHIRFQNTGTDTAFTVVIRDTLDKNLDHASVIAGSSSHDYKMEYEGEGVLVFRFENIMLPDSNVNEPESHGFIRFKIKQQVDLQLGTIISNRAGIYFDFNEPIITNTVFHTLGREFADEINSSFEPAQPGVAIDIYPNPMHHDRAMINLGTLKLLKGQVMFYSLTGQKIKEFTFSGNQFEIARQDLSSGVYIFQIIGDGQFLGTGKLIVQ